MISYEKSKTILKKAKIKIKDETIKSTNSINRVVYNNIYYNIFITNHQSSRISRTCSKY